MSAKGGFARLDLHTHLGGAVPAAVLWEILCDSGLQTEYSTFDQLQEALTVNPDDIRNLDDFLAFYFHASEFILCQCFQNNLLRAVLSNLPLVDYEYPFQRQQSIQLPKQVCREERIVYSKPVSFDVIMNS